MKKPLIILTGPTAVGKTELSIALAKKVNGEIISADSMQVYKGMDIGTAKINPEDMNGVPHYLIDKLEPEEDFHVVKFQEYAYQYMEKIYEKGKIPILVGGTGFYIQAVLNHIDFTDTKEDTLYREELETLAAEKGPEQLHELLALVDPQSALLIHANNVKRVIRALEYYKETGEPISAHNEQEREKTSPYAFAYFVLNDERGKLYERINLRIDKMIEEGLIAEVSALKKRGCTKDMVSMKGLGYKEILEYLEGSTTLEDAVSILKRDTRHFAKRQITWFKREREVSWVDKSQFQYDNEKILEYMMQILEEKHVVPGK